MTQNKDKYAGRKSRRRGGKKSVAQQRTAEGRRAAFRRFMDARGLKPAEWAKRAGLRSANTIYNFLTGDSDSLSQKTLEALAVAEGVNVSDIIGDTLVPAKGRLVRLEVVGEVQAGMWKEAVEWPPSERFVITLISNNLHRSTKSFGLVVAGESMNEVYPEGTILECVQLAAYDRALENENKVIVHRTRRDGLIEATVKEFEQRGNRALLWPRSTHPDHQVPIVLPWPPQDGEDPRDDGIEHIEIKAIVIRSIRNEV